MSHLRQNKEKPIPSYIADLMRSHLSLSDPLFTGAVIEGNTSSALALECQVQSQLAQMLSPEFGQPWVFCLHQCSGPRIWSDNEKKLLREIGRCLTDSLTRLLVTREMRESENRFRHAFEFSGIGMAMLSLDGYWLRANHVLCEMLDFSEAELQRMTCQELTDPEQLSQEQEFRRQLVSGEIPKIQFEKRYRHRQGHYLWVRSTNSVICDEHEVPLYVVAQIENIDQQKKAEQDLALLNFAINRVCESVYLMDEDAAFRYVNDEACRELGNSREALLNGMRVPDIDPDFEMTIWRDFWQELKTDGVVRLETTHTNTEGENTPVEVFASYFEYQGRGYDVALVRDISERKQIEAAQQQTEIALREQEKKFRELVENLEDMVWLKDVITGRLLYVNPAYESIWENSCEYLYRNPTQWIEALHPDDKERVTAVVSHQQEKGYDIEYRIVLSNGRVRHIQDRTFPIKGDNGQICRVARTARDITDWKEQAERIHYLAYHDALTGLPNRTLVMDRLVKAIAAAHRQHKMLAVLFLDLDNFKTINDTLGHQVGDILLQKTGTRLGGLLRDADTFGRVGGDEFLIILPDLDTPEDAAQTAYKLLDGLIKPFEISGHQFHINTSIGISMYPRDTEKSDVLVKYADSALYLAKEQGRNTFRFFSPELDARVHSRLLLENDLRSALDNNQFYLVYQPLVDLHTVQCQGAEALLRWNHPTLGLVSPDEFIPVAEDMGLIVAIANGYCVTPASKRKSG